MLFGSFCVYYTITTASQELLYSLHTSNTTLFTHASNCSRGFPVGYKQVQLHSGRLLALAW